MIRSLKKTTISTFSIGIILVWGMIPTKEAHACSSEPFIGSMCVVAFNFAPRNWAFAEGQILSISSNQTLFSLLGCTYGGDCRTSFGLPDTRGRTVIGAGQGAGLSNYGFGRRGGVERVAQTVQTLAAHSHTATSTVISSSVSMKASSGAADSGNPAGRSLATNSRAQTYNMTPPDVSMHADSIDMTGVSLQTTVQNTGGNQSFSIVQPYVALHWIIALQGLYPSRN